MDQVSKPWEKVSDQSYFRQVMGNMAALGFGPKNEGKAHTRFGNTGVGHAPNYQIESIDGAKHCFTGLNHKPAAEAEFETDNLSDERFSYSEIQAMLARLRARPRDRSA